MIVDIFGGFLRFFPAGAGVEGGFFFSAGSMV
jgi:hypothetical protein